MTVASDLAGAFGELELTVPVVCGASSARAFFDRAGTIRKVGGGPVQLQQDTLFIQRDSLAPDLIEEEQVTVGALGALSAVGGVLYRVTQINPQDDGLIQAVAIAGGAS